MQHPVVSYIVTSLKMAEGEDSAEYRAFRSLYYVLQTEIQLGIADVASQAFSKRIISNDVKDQVTSRMVNLTESQRTRILLDAIHGKIQVNTSTYEQFAAILKETPAYEDMAARMRSELEKQRRDNRRVRQNILDTHASDNGTIRKGIDSSQEHTIFRRNRTTLIKLIQHRLKEIANLLYGKEFLTESQHKHIIDNQSQASGAKELIDIVFVAAETDPDTYGVFIDVLLIKGNQALRTVVRNIEKECRRAVTRNIKKRRGTRPRDTVNQTELWLAVLIALMCATIGCYLWQYPISNSHEAHMHVAVNDTALGGEDIACDLQLYRVPIQQNLPRTSSPFFGRQHDLEKLKTILLSRSAQIININGPPAFGKSTLAIQVGRELIEHHSDRIATVRYIDTESTMQSWYLCTHNKVGNDTVNMPPNDVTHALLDSPESTPYYEAQLNDLNLCEWSQKLKRKTVFVLDNCDHILQGEKRDSFIQIIDYLLTEGRTNYLSIMITSQERLEFLSDTFTSWHLQELVQSDSVALLQHYVPGITDEQAVNLSSTVGNNPLALKVIGKLLGKKEHFKRLLKELEKSVVGTISDRITNNKERFSSIMSIAYQHLGPDTKQCSQIVSYFPGSFDTETEEEVVGKVMDPRCIQEVIRKSFTEEIFIGEETWYKMHKLIRAYFAEMRRKGRPFFPKGIFDHLLVDYYQGYLTKLMLNVYQRNLTDEEHHKCFYLEAHNIQYFAQLLTEHPSNKLGEQAALSMGFLIHEKLIQNDTVYKLILQQAYQVFTINPTFFVKLCTICTSQECANIYWKSFVTVSIPECIQDSTNSNLKLYWSVLTLSFSKQHCNYMFSCSNLTALLSKDQRIISAIRLEVATSLDQSDKLLLQLIEFAVHKCQWMGGVEYGRSSISVNILLCLVLIFSLFSFYKLYRIHFIRAQTVSLALIIQNLVEVFYLSVLLYPLKLSDKAGLLQFDIREVNILNATLYATGIIIFMILTIIIRSVVVDILERRIRFSRLLCTLYIIFVLVIPIIFTINSGGGDYILHFIVIQGFLRISELIRKVKYNLDTYTEQCCFVVAQFMDQISFFFFFILFVYYLFIPFCLMVLTWISNNDIFNSNETVPVINDPRHP